jgi:hypothetical protein
VQYSAVLTLKCAVQCSAVQCSVVQCSAVQCSAVQFSPSGVQWVQLCNSNVDIAGEITVSSLDASNTARPHIIRQISHLSPVATQHSTAQPVTRVATQLLGHFINQN